MSSSTSSKQYDLFIEFLKKQGQNTSVFTLVTSSNNIKWKYPCRIVFFADWCSACHRFFDQLKTTDFTLLSSFYWYFVPDQVDLPQYKVDRYPTMYLQQDEKTTAVQVKRVFKWNEKEETSLPLFYVYHGTSLEFPNDLLLSLKKSFGSNVQVEKKTKMLPLLKMKWKDQIYYNDQIIDVLDQF